MARTHALDTSVVVASLLGWHAHHEQAREAVDGAFRQGAVVLPLPALVESYAVLTRLPPPHRLSPEDALTLLRDNFEGPARVEGLNGQEVWRLLGALASNRIAGGRTYDAQILAAAVKAGADVLLTSNPSDFAGLGDDDVEIRDPLERR